MAAGSNLDNWAAAAAPRPPLSTSRLIICFSWLIPRSSETSDVLSTSQNSPCLQVQLGKRHSILIEKYNIQQFETSSDSIMEIEEPPPLQSRHSLPTVGRTCFIPAKQNGIASLVIQFIILLVSGMTVLFFFYHIGGYEYMAWNENSTIWEPVYNHRRHTTPLPTTYTAKPTTTEGFEADEKEVNDAMKRRDVIDILDDGADKLHDFLNDTIESVDNFTSSLHPVDSIFNLGADNETDNQIPGTVIYLLDSQLDMLEMIQISTLAYIVLAIFWFLSLILLLFSIKCEILELVGVNIAFLTVAILYLFIHAVFIAVLLYYQRDLPTRSMIILIGSAVTLFCTVAIGVVSLFLAAGWYKYIMYMNGGEKCYCLHLCVRLIKGERRQQPSRSQEYAMREAGRNPNDISYHEPPIENFNAF